MGDNGQIEHERFKGLDFGTAIEQEAQRLEAFVDNPERLVQEYKNGRIALHEHFGKHKHSNRDTEIAEEAIDKHIKVRQAIDELEI